MYYRVPILPHILWSCKDITISKNYENTNVIELISNLGHIVSANDDVIKNCEIFIKNVLYYGISKENYVCDCAIRQKQRTQYYFLQMLSHANKVSVERIIRCIISCIGPIKFSLNFH